MNINRITVRYAKALLQAAVEQGVADKIYQDMEFAGTIVDLPDFKLFLNNPSINTSTKNKVLNEVFLNKVNPLTITFLELLTKNKREIYLKSIARNYIKIYRDFNNITSVNISTAVEIGDTLKNKVKTVVGQILKKQVELSETTDADIIGGFVIRIDDKQYDASIKHKLEKVKRELLQKN